MSLSSKILFNWVICIGFNEDEICAYKFPKFLVMGHRGSGMNMLQSPDPRMKSIKENSILSFNEAAKFPIDFVEFDVQVRPQSLCLFSFPLTKRNITFFFFLVY